MSDEELREEVRTIKAEVDALQIAVMRKDEKKPWYTDPAKIISGVALMISLWSAWQGHVKDTEARRAELRQLIQRLAALPRERIETAQKFGNDRAALDELNGLTDEENGVIARQAAELIDELPSGRVTAIECISVANGLWQQGTPARVLHLYDLAEAKADNLSDKIYVVYSRGGFLLPNDPVKARAEFRRAVELAATAPAEQKWHLMKIYPAWATSELAMDHCAEARQAMAEAVKAGFSDPELQQHVAMCAPPPVNAR